MAASSSTVAAWLCVYSLSDCGPARARWLASHPQGLVGAVADLCLGDVSKIEADRPRGLTQELLAKWSAQITQIDADDLLKRHLSVGQILCPDDKNWCFEHDPEPPMFLHALGNTELLNSRPSVGIVGTRRCTTVGRRLAATLGAELAEAGVTVVSGLAKGVDGEAHRGTLAAGGRAVAVVASGLDVVYPRINTALWHEIGRNGLLISEAPLGTSPDRWRFPARNRIIAALSDFVVVVESHEKGGALSTAAEAALRGISVGAVPGSVASPASAGTNALLVDGAIPIRHTQDVLDSLGIFRSPAVQPTQAQFPGIGSQTSEPAHPDLVHKTQVTLGQEAQLVMDELQAGSAHIDQLLVATELKIPHLMTVVNRLASEGLVFIDGSTVVATNQSLNPPSRQARL